MKLIGDNEWLVRSLSMGDRTSLCWPFALSETDSSSFFCFTTSPRSPPDAILLDRAGLGMARCFPRSPTFNVLIYIALFIVDINGLSSLFSTPKRTTVSLPFIRSSNLSGSKIMKVLSNNERTGEMPLIFCG